MIASMLGNACAITRVTPRVLFEARSAANLSQKQLAERLECSPAFVKGIELGTQSVGRSDFMNFARGLRIEPSELFDLIMKGSELVDAELRQK